VFVLNARNDSRKGQSELADPSTLRARADIERRHTRTSPDLEPSLSTFNETHVPEIIQSPIGDYLCQSA